MVSKVVSAGAMLIRVSLANLPLHLRSTPLSENSALPVIVQYLVLTAGGCGILELIRELDRKPNQDCTTTIRPRLPMLKARQGRFESQNGKLEFVPLLCECNCSDGKHRAQSQYNEKRGIWLLPSLSNLGDWNPKSLLSLPDIHHQRLLCLWYPLVPVSIKHDSK